jgi:hypothetical protein
MLNPALHKHTTLCHTLQHRTVQYSWPPETNRNKRTFFSRSVPKIMNSTFFFMDKKARLSDRGKDFGRGCLRIGCWGWIQGVRGREWEGIAVDCLQISCRLCTAHRLTLGGFKCWEYWKSGVWHVWGRRNIRAGVWWGKGTTGKAHTWVGKIILKWISKTYYINT